jgi:uncharacterized protein YggE
MNDEHDIQFTVTGRSDAEFVSSTFTAYVNTRAATGPEAKKLAKPRIEAILATVVDHAKKGDIDTKRLKTTFAVDTDTSHTGEFRGYKAKYTINFKAKNVAHATAIHDALTSLEGVESPTPTFDTKDDDGIDPSIHERAFKNAVEKAKVRFEIQCGALGIDPKTYKIGSWSCRDEDYRGGGKFLAFFSPQLSTDLLELSGGGGQPHIEPGKAIYEAQVTFTYTRI